MNLAYKYYYTEKIKNGKKLIEYGYINYEHYNKVKQAKKENK